MDGIATPWFATSRARRLFSISAFLSVSLILFILVFATAVFFNLVGTIRWTDTILGQIFGFLLGVIGAPAAVFLWVGMLWHWHARARTSLGWLFFLVVGNWLAAPLYYGFVFRQSATVTPIK